MGSGKKTYLTSSQKRKIRNNMTGYAFILPNLIGYTVFVFIPVIFSFVLSVMSWDGSQRPMQFVGLANFADIFGDKIFRGTLVHTVSYALMTVVPTLVLALLLAVLLNNKIRGVAIFRTAFYFPYIASIVAVGAVWNMLFQPDFGPVNEILKAIGIANPPRWVVDKDWAMVAVSIVSVWKYMGYYMIVYLAALQGISASLYEAASIDGANFFQQLKSITIPLLKPVLVNATVLNVTYGLRVFDMVYSLTNGGQGNATGVINTAVYKEFSKGDLAMGTTLSSVLFFVVLALLYFIIKSMEDKEV